MSTRHSHAAANQAFYRSLTDNTSTFPPTLLDNDRMGVVTQNSLVYPVGVTPVVDPANFDCTALNTSYYYILSNDKIKFFNIIFKIFKKMRQKPSNGPDTFSPLLTALNSRESVLKFKQQPQGGSDSDEWSGPGLPGLPVSVPLGRYDRRVFAKYAKENYTYHSYKF